MAQTKLIKALSLSLLAVVAMAQDDQDTLYPRMADVMNNYGYTWSAHEVQTDDGYTLTTFRVTGTTDTGAFTPTRPPVLVMHGDTSDAASWLSYYYTDKPMMLQLADAGYDVWIGNNRGTEYSRKHTEYSDDSEEFWQFSWAEMGRYDDVANVKMIKE